MSDRKGLLLVTMEPQPINEEELNDWYDTEHLPERAAIPGFETALRYVCVSGWPKYLAVYDLDDVAVLDGADYKAVSGDHFSPWSKRVVRRVQGQYRAAAVQLYPGGRITGDAGGARGPLTVIRFRNAPAELEATLIEGLRGQFENRSEVAQLRVFRFETASGGDFLALVEQRTPLAEPSLDAAGLGEAADYIDMVNHYRPYWRHSPLPGVYSKA